MDLVYSSNNISHLDVTYHCRDPRQRMLHEKQEKKLSTGISKLTLSADWLLLLSVFFLTPCWCPFPPLQSVHQMELSWASKRKWSSLLRRWSDCIKRIQYPPYLVSNSDIGENLLIPVFRWARTRQETRQRSRRLKERSTVSSELKLFWQWPLVKSDWYKWTRLEPETRRCWMQRRVHVMLSSVVDRDWSPSA